MSSISSEEFLAEVITTFREEFKKLSPKSQRQIREKAFDDSFLEPCQIEVLDLGARKGAFWLVIHEDRFPDMMFKIHKGVESLDESEFITKNQYEFPLLMELFSEKRFEEVRSHFGGALIICAKNKVSIFQSTISAKQMGQSLLSNVKEVLKTEQVDVIIRSTEGLRKSIAKVPEKGVRDELLNTTRKIDGALREIRRIDEEIGKVRQLVGITKDIKDWKLLISDVDRLKGEHVPREVFAAKVNELNTRIDSLSEIREAYDKVLAQQTKVIEQQSSFIKWIKYATILLPIAVVSVPVIEITSILIRHFLGIS